MASVSFGAQAVESQATAVGMRDVDGALATEYSRSRGNVHGSEFVVPEASNWFAKLMNPIYATVDDLLHPIALLKSTQRFFFSKSDRGAAEGVLTPANALTFNVAVGRAPKLQLNSDWPALIGPNFEAARWSSSALDADMPAMRSVPARDSLPYRNAATQLQMRVHKSLSLLWEVDRSSSVFAGDETGVGLGVRMSF